MIVERAAVIVQTRRHRVKARLAESRKHRKRLRLATIGHHVERLFVGSGFVVHSETHRDVACFLRAEIRHAHLETQRLVHRRKSTRQTNIRHRHVALLAFVHEHHPHAHFLLHRFEQIARFRRTLPSRSLPVRHRVDVFVDTRLPLEHINRPAQRRLPLRRLITPLRIANHLPREREIVRRLRDRIFHLIRNQPHRHRRTTRQRIEHLLRRLLRFFKTRLRPVARRHRAGIIQQDDGRFIPAEDGEITFPQCRPRERQREQCDHETAQDEQNDVLDVQLPLIALHGDA